MVMPGASVVHVTQTRPALSTSRSSCTYISPGPRFRLPECLLCSRITTGQSTQTTFAMLSAAMAPEIGRVASTDERGQGGAMNQTTDNGAKASSLNYQPRQTPQKSRSPKARSLSDSSPQLEPSPKFREPARMSKDDHTIVPSTPRRPDFLTRGLSLQMPAREAPMPSPAHFAARVPLSPQLDARNTYASPLLPRRSRGAEFSRACTHLHHSTVPEQSSPDSSPTITQKGIKIPSRRPRTNSMLMGSPNVNMNGGWNNGGDRTAASSSVGSINMLGSEESSSSSDEVDPLDPEDNDDPMMGTPQAKMNLAFPGSIPGSNGGWAMNLFSPVAGGVPNFMSIQRARLRKGRSRKSSSSASGHSSSMASPGPASPPNGSERKDNLFAREAAIRKAGSRRESLSLFANDLHISSGNDSGDEGSTFPQTPGVVRRPVVRRGNLLVCGSPRSKGKAILTLSAKIQTVWPHQGRALRRIGAC
jgi:hypothetical protein